MQINPSPCNASQEIRVTAIENSQSYRRAIGVLRIERSEMELVNCFHVHVRNWRSYMPTNVDHFMAIRRILLSVTFPHHQRAPLMGITISHRVRRDNREAARTNSRRFLMERDAIVAEAGKRHNQFTQWNTVLFATARFMAVFKCLRKNHRVQTSLSWSGLKAHLIGTSMSAICATTRFASSVQSIRIQGIAMPVIQRSLGKHPSGNESTNAARIPGILHRHGQRRMSTLRCARAV